MNNGIKPTRLWHLTGKKHFWRNIKDRECAVPPHTQRERKDVLQLYGIAIASALAFMGSFGMFTPPTKGSTVMTKCDTSKSKKKTCKKPTEPCPTKPDKKMKPCKGDDDDE